MDGKRQMEGKGMRRYWFVMFIFLFLLNSTSSAYKRKWYRDVFTVYTDTPPAALLVIRTDGKRLGSDPDKSISSIGLGTVLNEFPLAEVEQQNISSDEGNPEPDKDTGWYARVMDESPSVYLVQLRGLADGIAPLTVSIIVRPRPAVLNMPTRKRILVSMGDIREFVVRSDAETYKVSVERVVKPGDLKMSVNVACRIGQISSEGICQSLGAKASAVAESLERGNKNSARGQLKAFINELNSQGKKHIKEPALTVLREEADAMMKTIGGKTPLLKEWQIKKAAARK